MLTFSASPGDMSTIVQNFLTSLNTQRAANSSEEIRPFPSLIELLSPSNTIPFIMQACDESIIDRILMLLPTEISELAVNDNNGYKTGKCTSHESNVRQLSMRLKKEMLLKVLRSPQLCQSLDSLSVALRGGGLLSVSEALDINLNNDLALENAMNNTSSLSPFQIFLNGIKSSIKK